jgi:hypothetical protein
MCLIGSRLVAKIEQLARPPSQFKMFEILRLTSDQVQGFLQELDLASFTTECQASFETSPAIRSCF